MKGIIFDIKRMALHDGPGIRQTVFLKGCPLACRWCHNPESQSKNMACFKNTQSINDTQVEEIETVGREISIQELMTFIKKDEIIYEESGGGITFSGGEPLMQPNFLECMLIQCNQHEIHTCVDTSGFASWNTLEKIIPHTNLFLFDLKHPDNKKHLAYTGVENTQILNNLYALDRMKKEIWIRIPFVPTFNDDESDFFRYIALLEKLTNKPPISLLPYHKIGSYKYDRFQLNNPMLSIKEPSKESISMAKQLFEDHGYHVTIGG